MIDLYYILDMDACSEGKWPKKGGGDACMHVCMGETDGASTPRHTSQGWSGRTEQQKQEPDSRDAVILEAMEIIRAGDAPEGSDR